MLIPKVLTEAMQDNIHCYITLFFLLQKLAFSGNRRTLVCFMLSRHFQYPHELISFDGKGQVFSNWAQVGKLF